MPVSYRIHTGIHTVIHAVRRAVSLPWGGARAPSENAPTTRDVRRMTRARDREQPLLGIALGPANIN